MRINTVKNPKLDDDEFVGQCMEMLQERYPSITGFHYERTGPNEIQLLIYGEFEITPDE